MAPSSNKVCFAWSGWLLIVALALVGCSPEMLEEDDPGQLEQAATSTVYTGGLGTAEVWAHFNFPLAHGGNDLMIRTELARMINATPAGETIRGNFFFLNSPVIATALNNAYDRGVTLRITLDGSAAHRASVYAKSVATHTGTSSGYCGGADESSQAQSCISSHVSGNAHIKFLTFSKTRAPNGVYYRDVSWFGSYNADPYAGGDNDSNNALSVYNSSVTYDSLFTHQIAMQNQFKYAGNGYFDASIGRGYFYDANANVEGYLSPAAAGTKSFILTQLEKITPDSTCLIRVQQAVVSDSMMDSIERLIDLKSKGCRVFFVVDAIGSTSLARLKAVGIEVRRLDNMHDKVILVDAKWLGGGTNHRFVFTGSHNWSTTCTTWNEELLARVESGALYSGYYSHFLDVWRAAARL